MADDTTTDDSTTTTINDAQNIHKETDQTDELRRIVGDVYSFVRSREINKTIASYTFDHYIDERKKAISGDPTVSNTSNPGDTLDVRPSELDALSKLEQDFNNSFTQLQKIAQSTASKNP